MLRRLGLLILAFVLAGCGAGAIQTTADEVLTVGGLKPNVKDKDAGLVAIAPGFDLKKYKLVAVEKFPVTDPAVKDEDDRRFGAKAARAQAELRFVDVASGQVVMATADRRIAKVGGSSTELVEESFDDMARDLAKFLIRLSKGEAPKD